MDGKSARRLGYRGFAEKCGWLRYSAVILPFVVAVIIVRMVPYSEWYAHSLDHKKLGGTNGGQTNS